MRTHRAVKKIRNSNRKNYQTRMYILLWLFGIMSLVVVPAFTIYMGAHGDPVTTSLSAIGNRADMRLRFIIWTITVCIYFATIVLTLITLTKSTRARMLRWFVFISTWTLLATNIIPFLPETMPFWARVHSRVAMISAILISFSLLLLTLSFHEYYPALFRKAFICNIILIIIMVLLFVLFSAKWITEGTGIIGGSVFLFTVLLWLYKENNFDADDVLHTHDVSVAEQEVKKIEKRAQRAYDEYVRFNELSRIAATELHELKRRKF